MLGVECADNILFGTKVCCALFLFCFSGRSIGQVGHPLRTGYKRGSFANIPPGASWHCGW